ncbi:histone-lysine N-methyltransferase SETMAR [Plakobranchus ocellatus]|uniref:Histone-lysine N-methyltransferase SETMAR n=1 Tax=Plakobranchus ocellatus TaxID=259542 RepID=A0AAV3Y5W5_9GAST|nr:histone-lysine N-methyltransferase SETMAR [Plakobranchus ocellatus]
MNALLNTTGTIMTIPIKEWSKLEHDNATPHSTNLTQQWLQRYGWEIHPYPAHSPDLAPSDFHLFEPLKRHLGGMAFETEDDLISELRNWFDNLDVDFFRVGKEEMLKRKAQHFDNVPNGSSNITEDTVTLRCNSTTEGISLVPLHPVSMRFLLRRILLASPNWPRAMAVYAIFTHHRPKPCGSRRG